MTMNKDLVVITTVSGPFGLVITSYLALWTSFSIASRDTTVDCIGMTRPSDCISNQEKWGNYTLTNLICANINVILHSVRRRRAAYIGKRSGLTQQAALIP